MWILSKMRFSKCEFLDKLRIFAPMWSDGFWFDEFLYSFFLIYFFSAFETRYQKALDSPERSRQVLRFAPYRAMDAGFFIQWKCPCLESRKSDFGQVFWSLRFARKSSKIRSPQKLGNHWIRWYASKYLKSHCPWNSLIRNLIFHILKISFFVEFTFSKSHFSQNSHFAIIIFH